MISALSDDDISILLEIIEGIMPQGSRAASSADDAEDVGMRAFRSLYDIAGCRSLD